jgi:hypothetical protein
MMTVKNGSTLKDALIRAGFSRSEVFVDEPWLAQEERLYVLIRPDDALYAHVRVDASEPCPRVSELVLSSEKRDFYGTHDPSIAFIRYPDGISVISTRHLSTARSSNPVNTVDAYLDVIASATPIPRWSHLDGHRELSERVGGNGTVRIAPWIGRLPLEEQERLGYRGAKRSDPLLENLLAYRTTR